MNTLTAKELATNYMSKPHLVGAYVVWFDAHERIASPARWVIAKDDGTHRGGYVEASRNTYDEAVLYCAEQLLQQDA